MSSSRHYDGRMYYNFLTDEKFVFSSSDFKVTRRYRTFYDAFLPLNDITLLQDILEQIKVFKQNNDARQGFMHRQRNAYKRFKSIAENNQICFTDFKQLRRVWGVPEEWIPRRVLIVLKEAWDCSPVSGFKDTKARYMRVYISTHITNRVDDDAKTFLKQCIRYLASFCNWMYSDASWERLHIANAVWVMGCSKLRNRTSAFSIAFRNSIECYSLKDITSSTHRYAKEIAHAVYKLHANEDDKEFFHWSVRMYLTQLLTWEYSSKDTPLANGTDIDCSPKRFSMVVGGRLCEHPWYGAIKEFSILLDDMLRHFGMIYSECDYYYYKFSILDEKRQDDQYLIYESLDALCDGIFINWSVPLMYPKLHGLLNVVNPNSSIRSMMNIIRQTLAYAIYFEFNTTLGDYTEKMSFKHYKDGTQGVFILKRHPKEKITFWAQ